MTTVITKDVSVVIKNATWNCYYHDPFSCMDGVTILSLHGTDAVPEVVSCLYPLIHSIALNHVMSLRMGDLGGYTLGVDDKKPCSNRGINPSTSPRGSSKQYRLMTNPWRGSVCRENILYPWNFCHERLTLPVCPKMNCLRT